MRRTFLTLVIVAAALVATACQTRLVVPEGPGPLRYRDPVFSGVTKKLDVPYGSAVGQDGETVELKMDVYRPYDDKVRARPAIVWIHGGSFAFGERTSPEIVDEATTFARKGYVSVAISYRLSEGGCTSVGDECFQSITDAQHDAQAAVRFLRKNAAAYGIDPTRIATAGTSAGAITALNVGYGPEDPGTSGNPGFDSSVRAAVSLSGARILTTPNKGEAKALLFHGTADSLVPYGWATSTVDAAKKAGLTVELQTWEGDGHVPYVEHRKEILTQTTNFLYWSLDLKHAAR